MTPRERDVDGGVNIHMILGPEALDVIGMGPLRGTTPEAPGVAGHGAPDIARTEASTRRLNILPTTLDQHIGVCTYTMPSSMVMYSVMPLS